METGSALYAFPGVTPWVQVNRWYFDPGNTGQVTEVERFHDFLSSLPEGVKVYMDTEGTWFKNLRDNPPGSVIFKAQMNSYHALYDMARSSLPREHTLTEYSFPMRNYWKQDDTWRKMNLALMPLMARLDAACPSIYDPYKNSQFKWSSEVMDWKEAMMQTRMALEMHEVVHVFVFHRWHMPNLNHSWGWELIPFRHFQDQLQAAADARFKGKAITGLIHWSNDTANWTLLAGQDPANDTLAQARTRGHMESENLEGEPAEAYIHRTHGRVQKIMRTIV